MFAFSGRVVSADRLKSNYLSVILRRERDGLLGPTVQVLVPTLVELRDGPPRIGAWTRVEALPAQSADLAQGLSGFDFIASHLRPEPGPDDTESATEAVDVVVVDPLDRQAIFP